ncbi:unnamed protein product, partial [Callosobruchus maculatus]
SLETSLKPTTEWHRSTVYVCSWCGSSFFVFIQCFVKMWSNEEVLKLIEDFQACCL